VQGKQVRVLVVVVMVTMEVPLLVVMEEQVHGEVRLN